MLPRCATVMRIAKVAILIAKYAIRQASLGILLKARRIFCPLGAEDSLPFARCLVVCCRQTIVCSHQTIVCSGHTIVWWEQTKCAKAFSLYHLA